MALFSNDRLKITVELISAGAILVGLIFVGLELKQSTIVAESDTMQGLLELSNQGLYEIATNPEFAEVVVKAHINFDDLTESEYLRYRSHIWADLNIWEHLFYSYRNATMDETLWGSWDKSMFSLICEEASKRVWDEIEPGFGAEFRVHLQGISTDDCASAGL